MSNNKVLDEKCAVCGIYDVGSEPMLQVRVIEDFKDDYPATAIHALGIQHVHELCLEAICTAIGVAVGNTKEEMYKKVKRGIRKYRDEQDVY